MTKLEKAAKAAEAKAVEIPKFVKGKYWYSAGEIAKADKRFGGTIETTLLADTELFGTEETFVTIVGANAQSSSTRLSAFMGKCQKYLISIGAMVGSMEHGYNFIPSALEAVVGKATVSASKKTGILVA